MITWDELPATVTTYLTAHDAHDVETAAATFTADATVADDGRTHRGRDEIRSWLERTSSEYTYTTTFTGATVQGTEVDVLQRLAGNFPGGVVELRYRFTLSGTQIARLEIAPPGDAT